MAGKLTVEEAAALAGRVDGAANVLNGVVAEAEDAGLAVDLDIIPAGVRQSLDPTRRGGVRNSPPRVAVTIGADPRDLTTKE